MRGFTGCDTQHQNIALNKQYCDIYTRLQPYADLEEFNGRFIALFSSFRTHLYTHGP